jgi:membrane protein YqaA with SNARE-associated domain
MEYILAALVGLTIGSVIGWYVGGLVIKWIKKR